MVAGAVELHAVDVDAPAANPEVTERVLDAALALVARWGVTKTALGDVAKEAGCSRATLYRAFPGGKQHLLTALALRELSAYQGAIAEAVDSADDLHEALTRGLVVADRLLRDHDAAQFIIAHEPGLLLPFLGFHEVERVYRATAGSLGPHLERFLDADRAAWAAEWAARLFITYLFNPSGRVDLSVIEDAHDLVGRYLLPAFRPTLPPTTV